MKISANNKAAGTVPDKKMAETKVPAKFEQGGFTSGRRSAYPFAAFAIFRHAVGMGLKREAICRIILRDLSPAFAITRRILGPQTDPSDFRVPCGGK